MLSNREFLRRAANFQTDHFDHESVLCEIRERMARHYAKQNGIGINKGGWVEFTKTGRTICQGWPAFYQWLKRKGLV